MKGKKLNEDKLQLELDFDYIELMSERMNSNKGSYESFNWTLDTNIGEIIKALLRHAIKLYKLYLLNAFGVKTKNKDIEDEIDHLAAIGCNAMIIYYHLKSKNK